MVILEDELILVPYHHLLFEIVELEEELNILLDEVFFKLFVVSKLAVKNMIDVIGFIRFKDCLLSL